MANSKQLISMIRSHAAGDDVRFLAVAEHIALDAERAGHARMAEDIRNLVDGIRASAVPGRGSGPPVPIAAPRGELASLMRARYPETRLADVVLSEELEGRVRRIMREHGEREALSVRGLQPRRKLLFSGLPGTGKSLTAAAVAGELGLPLFTILLDGVITKFLGETAAKLRLVFDSMGAARGVYFFDEVDALATRRGAENDVGEARRMLNSFLQFLDEDSSSSVIIASTNHRSLLDPAIFRRFDAALVYRLPEPGQIPRILRNRLPSFDLEAIDWTRAEAAAVGLSQADIVAAGDDAAREAVLEHDGRLADDVLIRALRDRLASHAD